MIARQTADRARDIAALALFEALIAELETSDLLVLSTPMHNFMVPAPRKLWIDQVVRFGRTFGSTPEGKIGLLKDWPTFVIVATAVAGPWAHQPILSERSPWHDRYPQYQAHPPRGHVTKPNRDPRAGPDRRCWPNRPSARRM